MFITQRQHEAIIAILQEQNAELKEERDLYRKWFLERAAQVRFPDPPTPTREVVTPTAAPIKTEMEIRKTFQLDRGDWSQDDRDIYEKYWRLPQRAKGIPDDEHDYWYHQLHGNQYPLLAFTADS